MPPRPRCSRTRLSPTRAAPGAPRPRNGSTARRPPARRATRSCRHLSLHRGFEPGERAELCVGQAPLELRERLAVLAALEPAADDARDRLVERVARDAAEEGRPDRRAGTERAADEDVVGADAVAVDVLRGRRLEAEVADPVLRTGVRAAVEMKPQLGDRLPEGRLEMLHEVAEPLLGLADGEVAVRLAGAGDRVRPDLVRLQRQAELVERAERGGDVDDARDDEVLLARQPDVSAEGLDEVGDGDQLVARRQAELHRDADERLAVLLGMNADVRRRLHVDLRQLVALQGAAELRLDTLEHPVDADVVDHELQARLDPRHAVLQILAPDGRDGAEDLVRLLLRDEDTEVARDARHRREPAADLHRIAVA